MGLTLLMVTIGLLGIYIEYGDPLAFIDMLYANRPFTAIQRLLTQPRVVLYYLSLLFFPVPWRLSVSHDIAVSTSLLSPLTTLPAIVAVIAIIGLCIAYHKKKPLICFAGLFFFLNHAVESTLLPLELVFEHRNYLPSFFLFLPLVHGVVRLTRDSLFSQKYGRYVVVGSSCIAIGLLGNWTFARNLVWLTEKSLWEDEISKHPQLSRPHHNLAWAHHQPRGEYVKALDLYKKALSLKSHSRFETASTLNNLGRILYLKGDYEQALTYLEQAIKALPQRRLAEYQIVMSLIQLDRWQEAQKQIDTALRHNPEEPFFLKLKGILLSLKDDEKGAAAWLRMSLKYNPYAIDARAHLSLVLSRMGLYEEAVEVVSGSPANEIGDPLILMALCEIEKHNGNRSRSDEYLNRLIGHQGVENVTNMLLSWRKDKLSLAIDYDHYLMTINE
jgi:tetratricopeptide (TPR) repeat protein